MRIASPDSVQVLLQVEADLPPRLLQVFLRARGREVVEVAE